MFFNIYEWLPPWALSILTNELLSILNKYFWPKWQAYIFISELDWNNLFDFLLK
jgi:hypothetical protein